MKLYGTFCSKEKLESLLEVLYTKFIVGYGKVFVLELKDSDELLVTYNLESTTPPVLLADTLVLHRKKETNTLYTINGLNAVIAKENSGNIDFSYRIDWTKYRSQILLTLGSESRTTNTRIYRIVSK